jgi:hypothetical protein
VNHEFNYKLAKFLGRYINSLINSSNMEKDELLHLPIQFRLYKHTIAPNLLCFVFACNGVSASYSKSYNFLAPTLESSILASTVSASMPT